MKDLDLKLLALGIALLLAIFVNSDSNNSQIGIVVPVEIRNIPQGRILVKPRNVQAQVTIKGPSFLVSQVPLSPPSIKVKIPSDVGRHYVASLMNDGLGLPPAVQVVNIEPSEVDFEFDDVADKNVPVVVPQIGTLPQGLHLDSLAITPDHLRLHGPESVVSKAVLVETDPIDLREIQGSLTKTVNVRSPGPLVDVSAPVVDVSVKVSSSESKREFTELPVEIRAPAGKGWTVEPSSVMVAVLGHSDIMRDLKKEEVIPYVRPKHTPTPDEELAVSVDLPAGLVAESVKPSQVRVIIPTPAAKEHGKSKHE